MCFIIALAGSDGQGQHGIVASEDEIAFENACVVTPANATLVKDLNLRVPAGTNLLVTGPNGSGAGYALETEPICANSNSWSMALGLT